MLVLTHIDLANDPAAAYFVKTEIVQVAFAQSPGELMSLEGPNKYLVGDAIITSSTGECWSVDRHRFEAKYQAVSPTVEGQDGAYVAKPVPVLARQLHEAFSVARSAGRDMLYGEAGDWLMQYAPNDYGVCRNQRFLRVYQKVI